MWTLKNRRLWLLPNEEIQRPQQVEPFDGGSRVGRYHRSSVAPL